MILIAVNSPNIRFRANGFDNFKIDSGRNSFSTSIFKSKFPDAFLNDGLKRSDYRDYDQNNNHRNRGHFPLVCT